MVTHYGGHASPYIGEPHSDIANLYRAFGILHFGMILAILVASDKAQSSPTARHRRRGR